MSEPSTILNANAEAAAIGPGDPDPSPPPEQIADVSQRNFTWQHVQAIYSHVNQDKIDPVQRDRARSLLDALAATLIGSAAKFNRDLTVVEVKK